MIHKDPNWIFIHTPKTGGTSIQHVFGEPSVFGEHLSYIDTLRTYKVDDPENYFRFSIVRNPWDWVVSQYEWARQHKPQRKFWIPIYEGSFEDFVFYDMDLVASLRYGHTLSQFWMLCDQERKLDHMHIIRFENLQEGFAEISPQLGCNSTLPHRNKAERHHYSRYYNQRTKEFIGRKYQHDIETFEYEF